VLLHQHGGRRTLYQPQRETEQSPRYDLAAEDSLGQRAGTYGVKFGHGAQLNRSLTMSSPV
jgi:hypothetical protein